MVRCVGWGGIPQAFAHPRTGKATKGWIGIVDELADLLSAEELTAARASTINAHYASPMVIKAMWDMFVWLAGRERVNHLAILARSRPDCAMTSCASATSSPAG